MFEVRRDGDGELCGFVAHREGHWSAMTVFGGLLGSHPERQEAEDQTRAEGLAALAERWTLVDGHTGAEEVVCIQEASTTQVTVALGWYFDARGAQEDSGSHRSQVGPVAPSPAVTPRRRGQTPRASLDSVSGERSCMDTAFVVVVVGVIIYLLVSDGKPTPEGNKKEIRRLESRVERTGLELGVFETRVVAPMRRRLEIVESRLASLDGRLLERDSEMTVLRRRLGELEQEVDRLRQNPP